MNDPDDLPLRELLRGQLAPDKALVPDFDCIWSAATARHHRARLTRLTALSTALLMLTALGTFVLRPPAKPHTAARIDAAGLPWRTSLLLSEWRAPTDALLSSPDVAPLLLDLHK